MTRATNAIFLALVFAGQSLVSTSCSKVLPSTNDPGFLTVNGLTVQWTNASNPADLASAGNYQYLLELGNNDPNDTYSPVCFENNFTCRRADPIRGTIGNNPVALQGFQLNFTQSGETVQISSASVTHAELLFDTGNGKLGFGPVQTDNLVSSGCSLSDPNSVGYAPPATGSPGLITALYLADEGIYNSGQWTSASLTAGRVWYSGLVPSPGASNLFHWDFYPQASAATSDFGLNAFQAAPSAGGVLLSPKFSSSLSADPNGTHVLLGFCINGTKTITSSHQLRPLLLESKVRLYHPQLIRQ